MAWIVTWAVLLGAIAGLFGALTLATLKHEKPPVTWVHAALALAAVAIAVFLGET